jgi:hypothetical protein
VDNVFNTLPGNFFSPLSSPLREHYAALLLIFYDKFMEFPTGVEKDVLIGAYEEYFSGLVDLDSLLDENGEEENITYERDPRGTAFRFQRRLVGCGWMSEEYRTDYIMMVNITTHARPFLEALYRVRMGLGVEYEGHIIGVYSSLCSDSVRDNGHYAVLNAHYHTKMLMESLKVLSQNIKQHIQHLYDHTGEISEILHIHYDVYMNEIIDRAYTRLKTSENLSRYRPKISETITELTADTAWLSRTAEKMAIIKHQSHEQSKRNVVEMLKEIRNDLRSIDPIIAEIDDKNRRYSRISTERIKSKLYTDENLQQKLHRFAEALDKNELQTEDVAHGIYRAGYLSDGSLYRRWTRRESLVLAKPEEPDEFEMERMEAEIRLRIANQLNPEKIREYMDSVCPGERVRAEEIVEDMDSFIRVMYAALYAESRDFAYTVQWHNEYCQKDRFRFRDHSLVKKEDNG